jgi:RsiW-degrading membrane proteinase PrsW (M82 family)
MLYVYILIAAFIAAIWLRYFRDIDVFEREQWLPMVVSFLLGGASVFLLFGLNDWFLDAFYLPLSGVWYEDLLFIALKVAGPEEGVKVIAFLVSFLVMRKHFNEPLDYLIYCSLSALGFSAVENVLYFNSSGASIIVARGILSTVGHMFDTALFAYGLILYRFRYQGTKPWLLVIYFSLAVLAHTTYNFPLMHEGLELVGFMITILFFLFTISIYAVILNNALNQSPYFKQEIVVDSSKVSSRLITSYLILLLIQVGLIYYQERKLLNSVLYFRSELFSTGIIVLISSVRLSRFLLIPGRWLPFKFELPFGIPSVDPIPIERGGGRYLYIKGESYDGLRVHSYFGKTAKIRPLNRKRSRLKGDPSIQLISKHFIAQDLIIFKAKFEEDGQVFGLIPKRQGKNFISEDNHPVLGSFAWTEDFDNDEFIASLEAEDMKIHEWIVLLPEDYIDY